MAEEKKNSVVERAQDNYKLDMDHWGPIYEKAKEDLYFLSDDEYAQWNEKDAKARRDTNRPALTIDQLGQFIHQVANDIRMNTPTIHVIPAGKESDVPTAEVFKGLIKNIEYISAADDVYDTASLFSIKCSIGFIRVDHDYVDDGSFDQQLLIKRVINPLAVIIDRDSIECDGRDMKHGTILDKMTVEKFKSTYPKFEVSDFTDAKRFDRKDGDYITIAEYFEIEESAKMIGLNADGQIEEVQEGVTYSQTRPVQSKIVRRYKLSGTDVLDETTFPGIYIPIVPVYGEEAWIEGKRNLFSLIRKSKQAQQMYNLWKSLETEMLQKQPLAPVMAAANTIENYAEDWLNPSKSMALRYDAFDDSGNPLPPPQRLAPPQIPTGIVNASRMTVDDIKSTMGIYSASLGQRSNETSGVAIEARGKEGDVATFHFADNLSRSITQVGRIIVNAAPEVYDTARIERIIGDEDEPTQIGLNGMMVPGQTQPFDIRKGKYDVKVMTGAPFATRRQEAASFFSDVVKQQPQMMMIMGDLLFKNMDISGAQAMADRMKKVINPKLLDDKAQPDDPEKLQLQQAVQHMQQVIQMGEQKLQQQGQELQQLQAQVKSKDGDTQAKVMDSQLKAQNDQAKTQIEYLKVQQADKQATIDAAATAADLELKQRQLDLQEMQIVSQISLDTEAQEMQRANQILAAQPKLTDDVNQ